VCRALRVTLTVDVRAPAGPSQTGAWPLDGAGPAASPGRDSVTAGFHVAVNRDGDLPYKYFSSIFPVSNQLVKMQPHSLAQNTSPDVENAQKGAGGRRHSSKFELVRGDRVAVRDCRATIARCTMPAVHYADDRAGRVHSPLLQLRAWYVDKGGECDDTSLERSYLSQHESVCYCMTGKAQLALQGQMLVIEPGEH
jgi:hypothetical protein